MEDEAMFPPTDEETQDVADYGDVTFPEDEAAVEETVPETETEKADEVKPESAKEEEEEPKKEEDDEEEIDLESLLDSLSENEDSLAKSDDAIANIEKNNGAASEEDIAVLKEENARMADAIKSMGEQLRKLSNDKADLMYKNAELEAFGGESTNPKVMIISRNIEKASNGDDRAKSKIVSVLKDMLEEMTGEDYESKQTEKKVDLISAAERYNSASNPNIKSAAEMDDNTLVM